MKSSGMKMYMSKTWVVFVCALVCCFLWGSAFPCIKIGYSLFSIGASAVSYTHLDVYKRQGQGQDENRTIQETLDIGWKLLHMLPREELDRVNTKILEQYYPAEEKEQQPA